MKAFILISLMTIMSGCAALDVVDSGSRVPVQYATLKVIENSSTITAQDVLDHTERVRQLVNSDINININALVVDALTQINIERFDPADQLLLHVLFYQIEEAVLTLQLDLPTTERRVRLLTLLDWIDRAARLAA